MGRADRDFCFQSLQSCFLGFVSPRMMSTGLKLVRTQNCEILFPCSLADPHALQITGLPHLHPPTPARMSSCSCGLVFRMTENWNPPTPILWVIRLLFLVPLTRERSSLWVLDARLPTNCWQARGEKGGGVEKKKIVSFSPSFLDSVEESFYWFVWLNIGGFSWCFCFWCWLHHSVNLPALGSKPEDHGRIPNTMKLPPPTHSFLLLFLGQYSGLTYISVLRAGLLLSSQVVAFVFIQSEVFICGGGGRGRGL